MNYLVRIKNYFFNTFKNLLVFWFEPPFALKFKKKSWKKIQYKKSFSKYTFIYLVDSYHKNEIDNNYVLFFKKHQYENLIFYFHKYEKLFLINPYHEVKHIAKYLIANGFNVVLNKD